MSCTKKIRDIVIPVDASEHSKRALNWYLSDLMKPRDVVHFVHILNPQHIADSTVYESPFANNRQSIAGKSANQHENKSLAESKQLQKEFLNRTKFRNLNSSFDIIIGSPCGEQVAVFAKCINADIIVIGNRGMNAVKQIVLGSTSKYLLHNTHIPVVVVLPKSPEAN